MDEYKDNFFGTTITENHEIDKFKQEYDDSNSEKDVILCIFKYLLSVTKYSSMLKFLDELYDSFRSFPKRSFSFPNEIFED